MPGGSCACRGNAVQIDSLRPDAGRTAAASEIYRRQFDPGPMQLEPELSARLGTQTYAKYEIFNPVQSFKLRGALYLVDTLVNERGAKGLVTVSTGNHGAAMAFVCSKYGVPLTVGVPRDCDASKVALIEAHGPELIFHGSDYDEALEYMLTREFEPGHHFVHDGVCPEINAGTSSIGLEIAEQLPDVEVVLVPVGGGALIGGLGTALKERLKEVELIGVQAERAPSMYRSFLAGQQVSSNLCDTFASGIAVGVASPHALRLLREVVDEMLLVSEADMKQAMRLFFETTGHLPEGAGAAALAGALQLQDKLAGRKVCLLVSGSNVDEKLRTEVLGESATA